MARNTELQGMRSTDSVERTLNVSLAELNTLDGITATATELNRLDGFYPFKMVGTEQTKADSYTCTLTDAGTVISLGAEASKTLTIPANSSVAFPVGTVICFRKTGANNATLAVTTDTLLGSTTLTASGGFAMLIKVAATVWFRVI